MKKILLGTSAIAGAAMLFAAPAHAELEVKFAGSFNTALQMSDLDGQSGDTNQGRVGWNVNQNNSSNELQWRINGESDHGFSYGANWDFRPGGTGATDEQYVHFSGGFGRVHIGQDDSVIDNMEKGAESHLRGGGAWDGRYNDAISVAISPDLSFGLDDGAKIAYYSPDFGGFQVGASISPSEGTRSIAATAAPSGTATTLAATNTYSLAAQYAGDFGDVSFGASAGYIGSSDVKTNVRDETNTNYSDLESYRLGVEAAFGGFGLGLSYGNNEDGLSSAAERTSGFSGYEWYGAAVSYDFGGGGVSLSYIEGESTDTARLTTETDSIVLSADYSLGEGLGLYAELGKTSQELTNRSDDIDQTALVIGTSLSW